MEGSSRKWPQPIGQKCFSSLFNRKDISQKNFALICSYCKGEKLTQTLAAKQNATKGFNSHPCVAPPIYDWFSFICHLFMFLMQDLGIYGLEPSWGGGTHLLPLHLCRRRRYHPTKPWRPWAFLSFFLYFFCFSTPSFFLFCLLYICLSLNSL